MVGVHVSPTVFFNVRGIAPWEDGFQRTDIQCRVWKSGASAAASRQPNGESGSPRTWFDDIKDVSERIYDELHFFFFFLLSCFCVRVYGARAKPVRGEVEGKTNHVSFQNFRYEAAVDPSEHNDDACSSDKKKQQTRS